jgi:hypothetical protein
VALVGALVFAAECWTSGCDRLSFYRGERAQGPAVNAPIQDDAARTRAEELFQRYVETAEGARGRALPVSAATFVLGAALLALGARAMAGKSNARSALMQVVAVQAIVMAASWYITRDVNEAELDWRIDANLARQREVMSPSAFHRSVVVYRLGRKWLPPGWIVFRTLASTLILVALSRPRSREFFEAAARNATAER